MSTTTSILYYHIDIIEQDVFSTNYEKNTDQKAKSFLSITIDYAGDSTIGVATNHSRV
jgi:hypothetical protein